MNIPDELKRIPQWVCAGEDKKPINPKTGLPASIRNPEHWGTFAEAIDAGYDCIGFVLTDSDPYTIIDLDNSPDKPATEEQLSRHKKIISMSGSYIERSVSGHGYHIIVKGKIPSGARKDKVEIYSSERYMICTGNIVQDYPITDRQELLDVLYKEMKNGVYKAELLDLPDIHPDSVIIEKIRTSNNKEKFDLLFSGNWETDYPSQSEADHALLGMLCAYTQSNAQVKRIFRMSVLGQREKALREDYLNGSLQKLREESNIVIDFDNLRINEPIGDEFEEDIEDTPEPELNIPLDLPQGLLADLAAYFYKAAVRPIPEAALISALGLMAGSCGRAYNISGTGLNIYLVFLAQSGRGKESIGGGIEKIIGEVEKRTPAAEHIMGPASMASGQALTRHLQKHPCFVSVLGEVGHTIQEICQTRATSANIRLKQVLLNLYAKSGEGDKLRPTIYADSDKNTETVLSPAFSFIGESTPDIFYSGLSEDMVAQGLVPRLTVVEYKGKRPPRNRAFNIPPPEELVERIDRLVNTAFRAMRQNKSINVGISGEAEKLLDHFDEQIDRIINETINSVEINIWNRAHLKALKIAALVAVGNNIHSPIVTEDIAKWAIQFVDTETRMLSQRFSSGDFGSGDTAQAKDLERILKEYLSTNPKDQPKSVRINETEWKERFIPHRYIYRVVLRKRSFYQDPKGASLALDYMIRSFIASGLLAEPITKKVQRGKKLYKILRTKL